MTVLSRTIKIVIVDDHPMMREGLASQIGLYPDLQICGQADDVESGFQLIGQTHPDLAIIDIALKTGNGIDLIKRVRQRYPNVKLLVNSMYDESVYAERALQAGAVGYLCKQTIAPVLIDAIRSVMSGKVYLSPELTERIVRSRVGGMVEPGVSPVEKLSNRELEVLNLIGKGKTTGQIADQLFLSVHTIDTYREKLKQKLGLSNSAELNRFAAQWVLENG